MTGKAEIVIPVQNCERRIGSNGIAVLAPCQRAIGTVPVELATGIARIASPCPFTPCIFLYSDAPCFAE